jgi:hypothetical protein
VNERNEHVKDDLEYEYINILLEKHRARRCLLWVVGEIETCGLAERITYMFGTSNLISLSSQTFAMSVVVKWAAV